METYPKTNPRAKKEGEEVDASSTRQSFTRRSKEKSAAKKGRRGTLKATKKATTFSKSNHHTTYRTNTSRYHD